MKITCIPIFDLYEEPVKRNKQKLVCKICHLLYSCKYSHLKSKIHRQSIKDTEYKSPISFLLPIT